MIRDRRLSQIEGAIQTGRGDGMFTMDAYWKEYISKRDRFTPPYESFKPSVEATSEILYRTPLIDSHVPAWRSSAPAAAPPGMPVEMPLKPHPEDYSGYYVIEEEADVDELVKQIKKSGQFEE